MGLVWREITLRVLVRRIVGLVWREITLRVLVRRIVGLVWREITLRVLVRRIVGFVWREITLRVLVRLIVGLVWREIILSVFVRLQSQRLTLGTRLHGRPPISTTTQTTAPLQRHGAPRLAARLWLPGKVCELPARLSCALRDIPLGGLILRRLAFGRAHSLETSACVTQSIFRRYVVVSQPRQRCNFAPTDFVVTLSWRGF